MKNREEQYRQAIYALLLVIVILLGGLLLGGHNYQQLEDKYNTTQGR